MMKKTILLFMASLLLMGFAQAQKIKVESGDLSFLKDLAELNITFEYPDNMKLGKTTQEKYIDDKVRAAEEKEAGSGEAWKEKYFADRTEHYEPMFMSGLDKYTGDLYVVQDDDSYEYTLIVKTTFMEPGFNMGIQSKKSAVDLELTFVETANPDQVISVVLVSKAPGAATFDQGLRVGDAYFTAAQSFGKYLKKKYM